MYICTYVLYYRINLALTAEKYAPNKGYALNKQSYCIYTYYYDEFSVVMLVHLFTFAAKGNPQSGVEWQKAKITWSNTCTRV